MKQYQSCEVEIIAFKELDVITTSGQNAKVSKDYFGDTWWTTTGGEEQ